MTEQEIRDLFKSKNVPLNRDDVWTVQKAQVVKHKALERLAAALKISYAPPQVLRAERDEAVILVTGTIGDMTEWSVGEAIVVPMRDTGEKNQWGKPIMEPVDGAIGNYQVSPKQASYVWAMAEKRAKDRVILKLAGLHGAYSEDEADDFKQTEASPPAPVTNPTFDRIKSRLEAEGSNVDAILQDEGATIAALPEDLKARLRTIVRFVREARKVAA